MRLLQVSSVDVEGVLLLLKIAFLVLLYLFIWRIVRTASKDLRLPQESFILAPHHAEAAGLRERRTPKLGRLFVVKSPALDEKEEFVLDSQAITIGRGSQNTIPLDDDEFASAEHARIEPRQDGVWLEDVGSTNGTYLNGVKLTRPRKLTPGDLVRVGETDFRFDR
jgi:FHA domain